jgi:hypothetical protein
MTFVVALPKALGNAPQLASAKVAWAIVWGSRPDRSHALLATLLTGEPLSGGGEQKNTMQLQQVKHFVWLPFTIIRVSVF